MPLLFLPSVLLVQSVKGGVVVAGVEVEEILQGEALHGGGRMELGGGGVVDGEGGEEVALNDGVQALEVDVFGENAFGGEFVHEEVGIVVWWWMRIFPLTNLLKIQVFQVHKFFVFSHIRISGLHDRTADIAQWQSG